MAISCTIVLPTRDRPNMLVRSVESALKAIPKDGEVVVVDDYSDQPASAVLSSFSDPRLHIISNTGNSGVSSARNFGVSYAAGNVIFFLDDDDEIAPDYCSYVLNVISTASPSPDYGFSSYFLVQDTANNNKRLPSKVKNNKLSEGFIQKSVKFRHRICGFGAGFWMKKSVFDALGKLDENLHCNEDTEYSCRLLLHKKQGWFSEVPGVSVHDHAALQTGDINHLTHRISGRMRADCFARIIALHAELLRKDPDARHHLRMRMTAMLLRSGQRRRAFSEIKNEPSIALRLKQYICLAISFIKYLGKPAR